MEQEKKILINSNWKFYACSMVISLEARKHRNMMIRNGMISGFRILLGFRISWEKAILYRIWMLPQMAADRDWF